MTVTADVIVHRLLGQTNRVRMTNVNQADPSGSLVVSRLFDIQGVSYMHDSMCTLFAVLCVLLYTL